jgi:hypothetical protein
MLWFLLGIITGLIIYYQIIPAFDKLLQWVLRKRKMRAPPKT